MAELEGTVVEPFLVRAIDNYLVTQEKTELKFKKGQAITVEKVNNDSDMYFGFYGKKEGWFPNYYATKVKGGKPEIRKQIKKPTAEKKKPAEKPVVLSQSAPVLAGEAVSSAADLSDVKGNGDGTPSRKELKKLNAQKRKEDKILERTKKITKVKGPSGNKPSIGKAAGKKGKGKHDANEAMIPPIVEETITYLEADERLQLEGIFRVSGSLNDVKLMKESYQKNKQVDLSKCHDPHTVAGVLKIYFRESVDPLLTFAMYDAWIKVMAEGNDGPKVLAQKLRLVLKRIPAQNQLILKRLMELLTKIAANSDKNLMNVNNIAIVFAPTLLRPPGDAIEAAISNSSYSNNLVKFMIEHNDLMFGPEEPTPASENGAAAAETDEELEKKMKRGSLLLARGSFIGTRPPDIASLPPIPARGAPPPSTATPNTTSQNKPSSAPNTEEDLESEEVDDDSSDSEPEETTKAMTMDEMMTKILDGSVSEVDEYLATLDPTIASTTKKELLKRIDDFLKTEEYIDD